MFSNNDIYVDDKMNKLILRTKPNTPPENAPRIAIQNLRAVVGVFKYMQEPKIEAIFKKEKIRMGAVIDGIDTDQALFCFLQRQIKKRQWRIRRLFSFESIREIHFVKVSHIHPV